MPAGPTCSVAVDRVRQAADRHLLVFAAPQQVVSWTRSEAHSGWVIYFKADFLSLTDAHVERQFRLFQPGGVNIQTVPDALLDRLRGYCQQMRVAFDEQQCYRQQVLRGLFTAFLFECLALSTASTGATVGKATTEVIPWRFRHLLNRYFLKHRKVAEYAELLCITPGYLTEVVPHGTGRSASELIAGRIFYEAEQLLLHTELSIADVSARLQFSEPTHFARFFKRRSGLTPLEFRKSGHTIRDRG